MSVILVSDWHIHWFRRWQRWSECISGRVGVEQVNPWLGLYLY